MGVSTSWVESKLPFFRSVYDPEAVESLECEYDGDCPSKEACFDNECENPCLRMKPCPLHSECYVKDEIPRVMVCKCKPGYIERGQTGCELIRKSSS